MKQKKGQNPDYNPWEDQGDEPITESMNEVPQWKGRPVNISVKSGTLLGVE